MTAAYRLKGLGWLGALAALALALYLLSSQVAVERKKLDAMDARIAAAQRDIRALETEFQTRGNMAQLERWNGDTLALAVPVAAQFVDGDAQLASLDPNGLPIAGTRTAALVVPAGATPAPLPSTPSAPVPDAAPAPVPLPAPAPVQVAAIRRPAPAPAITPAVQIVVPTGRAAPAIARAAAVARGQAAVARVRPQAVALLDRQLLSDSTFGDIMSGARREARR